MAKRTRAELDTLVADFRTGEPRNITAEKFRNYETDLLDTLLPAMQDVILFGLSADNVPTAGELTIQATNGAGVIPAFTDRYMLIARLASEPDITSVRFSDDQSMTNQIGAFTKSSIQVIPPGETVEFAVWVSNQLLTQPAPATATVG